MRAIRCYIMNSLGALYTISLGKIFYLEDLIKQCAAARWARTQPTLLCGPFFNFDICRGTA